MTETVKIWFAELYQAAIEEAEQTIKNEELWRLGTTTEEDWDNHTNNIRELNDYISCLKDKQKELCWRA